MEQSTSTKEFQCSLKQFFKINDLNDRLFIIAKTLANKL